MIEQSVPPESRLALRPPALLQLAQVLLATLLVVGGPVATVWWLRASGTVSSVPLAVFTGMVLSLAASNLACRLWERRPHPEDLLFSDLMIWGYAHRWMTRRRLNSALATVGSMSHAQSGLRDGLTSREQARLLEHLAEGIESRDPYLHGHSKRVARHAWMIARQLGLAPDEVARVRTAAAIHDVGKVKTPTHILHKAAALTDDEYDIIKRHPADGAAMAEVLRDPGLTAMVRHHHERLDGTGYPDRLSEERIPLGARIIAVADTFDAITSRRPYRNARAHRDAIRILRAEAGTQLDPVVVQAFCRYYTGRRPITVSSILAGLPERVATWLGSSAGTVATAAKVLAVGALVSATTVASAATPRASSPVRAHRPSGPNSGAHSAEAGATASVSLSASAAGAGAGVASKPGRASRRPRHRSAAARRAHGSASASRSSAQSGVAAGTQAGQPGSTAGSRQASAVPAAGGSQSTSAGSPLGESKSGGSSSGSGTGGVTETPLRHRGAHGGHSRGERGGVSESHGGESHGGETHGSGESHRGGTGLAGGGESQGGEHSRGGHGRGGEAHEGGGETRGGGGEHGHAGEGGGAGEGSGGGAQGSGGETHGGSGETHGAGETHGRGGRTAGEESRGAGGGERTRGTEAGAGAGESAGGGTERPRLRELRERAREAAGSVTGAG